MSSRKWYLATGIVLLFLILLVPTLQAIRNSQYISSINRINVGVWGRGVAYIISFSKTTNQYYVISYKNSESIIIPGGLKQYRVGALGKVASLQGDPLLIKKALSQVSGLPLNGVIYHDTDQIAYDEDGPMVRTVPDVVKDFRSRAFDRSDLNFVDRIYLYQRTGNMRTSNTQLFINTKPQDGLFFDRQFRNEKRLVQIVYQHSENTAILLTRLLENIGIRVVDIIGADAGKSKCTIVENTSNQSMTAVYLARYYDCDMMVGDTGLYEIKFLLGSNTEKEWSL